MPPSLKKENPRGVPALVCVLLAASPATAQHDIQRNAVQQIARGNHEQAAAILASGRKPDSGEAETRFVEMLSLLAQDKIEEARAKYRDALHAGLPPQRFQAGPRDLLAKLAIDFDAPSVAHGPMVGHVTGTAASFWLRTAKEAKVTVVVGEEGHQGEAQSTAAQDFTVVVRVEGLKPATRYPYLVLVDGEMLPGPATFFTTSPTHDEPRPFAVGFGGGAGFIPEWERMWDSILTFHPHSFLMLGDNVYIDDPEHVLTQRYCYYRRQSRPEWRRFTASTAIYSIWDDHDFGTDDCVPGAAIDQPAWKRDVWKLFQQNWVNPAYGGGEANPGCWYDFTIADVHFIMLDGRYYRDLNAGSMLGPVQKAWLKKTLEGSQGTFKVIASPVPFSPNIKPGSKDPWDGFPEERAEIFAWIANQKIEGVILIAADRHRTDLRTIENPGSYQLYEFESSRLTNRHTHPVVKTDSLVWGYNQTCSFGLMKFDTTLDDPQVVFECIDIDGKIQHTHTLKRSQLRGGGLQPPSLRAPD